VAAEQHPDVVLAFCSGMARFALEPPLSDIPCVIDLVDADSMKWADLAAKAIGPMSWIYRREARLLSRFEAQAVRRAFATAVVNDRERVALIGIAAGARIDVVENGVDCDHLRPPSGPSSAANVVFCGVMDYPPNVEGAVWLAEQVWPLVTRSCREARLTLVGSNPTAAVRRLTSARRKIDVTGDVVDVRPYLWNAAVAAAPLHVARGVQNKVLEAIAAGLPPVVTSAVAGGLPSEVLAGCAVADTPEEFADAIVSRLRLSPQARRALVACVDLSSLSWSRRLAPLVDLLRSAAKGVRPNTPLPTFGSG
jgi:glycosyltransferase involved in cell wall biosynthesis